MNQPLIGIGVPPITKLQSRGLVDRVVRISGIQSGSDKPEFVRSRLAKRLQELNCDSFDAYLGLLTGPNGRNEEPYLVEALTTHTTSFFREPAHFDWISERALPELISQGVGTERDLVVWSAAVSTGAELWSAAMTIEEFQSESGYTVRHRLLGTDVSRAVLHKAAKAVFSEPEIKGISEPLRAKYLLRTPRAFEGDARFKIVPKLAKRARLAHANLVSLSTGPQITADIVLLRNVLIYFNRETQIAVARAIHERMRPGAFLFIAHSESLRDTVPGLISVGNSIYQKVDYHE